MQIGEIFAYKRPYTNLTSVREGLPNYFYETYLHGHNLPLLDKGINKIADVKTVDGLRTPSILISSSPHKTGTIDTPWQDYFDPDNGHIRYYGDNKKTWL